VGGVHAGYNIQCGSLVAGLETDINYANLSANSGWPDPIFLHSKVDWFGTVRGRLGVAVHCQTAPNVDPPSACNFDPSIG